MRLLSLRLLLLVLKGIFEAENFCLEWILYMLSVPVAPQLGHCTRIGPAVFITRSSIEFIQWLL
jgi:hypothetical protein